MTHGMKFLAGCLLIVCNVLLSGCANEFEEHFVGERGPETAGAVIVPWGAVPEGRRLAGQSEFLSTRDAGNNEALAAARSVGADAVAWRRSWKRDTQHTGYDRIMHTDRVETKGNVGGVPFNSTSTVQRTESRPYQYTLRWYQYEARFYRTLTPAPPAGNAAEATGRERP